MTALIVRALTQLKDHYKAQHETAIAELRSATYETEVTKAVYESQAHLFLQFSLDIEALIRDIEGE